MRDSRVGLGLLVVVTVVALLGGCASHTTIPEVDDTTPVVVYFWPSTTKAGTEVTGVVALSGPAPVDTAVNIQAIYNGGIVNGLPVTKIIPAGGVVASFPVKTMRELTGHVVVEATANGASDYGILLVE